MLCALVYRISCCTSRRIFRETKVEVSDDIPNYGEDLEVNCADLKVKCQQMMAGKV